MSNSKLVADVTLGLVSLVIQGVVEYQRARTTIDKTLTHPEDNARAKRMFEAALRAWGKPDDNQLELDF